MLNHANKCQEMPKRFFQIWPNLIRTESLAKGSHLCQLCVARSMISYLRFLLTDSYMALCRIRWGPPEVTWQIIFLLFREHHGKTIQKALEIQKSHGDNSPSTGLNSSIVSSAAAKSRYRSA